MESHPEGVRFETFFEEAEPRLRRALVATHGPEIGREAAAEALSYAWQHWDRIGGMDNPVGYLYRVGQTRARRLRRPLGLVGRQHELTEPPWVEPGLASAIDRLSAQQRVSVVLCHGLGWTHQEVADLLGVRRTTVQNHVERGLAKLRKTLEVHRDG